MKKILMLIASVFLMIVGIIEYPFITNTKLIWVFVLGLGIIGIVFVITLYIMDNRNKKIKNLENRLEAWNSMAYNVKRAGDETFNELPIGIISFDSDNFIKWANPYTSQIFGQNITDKLLFEIDEKLFELLKDNKDIYGFTINGKCYDIIFRSKYKLLYLFDVTEREEIKNLYKNSRLAIAIISLDNLDEALEGFDVYEKSKMRGLYLGAITDWAEKYNAFLQTSNEQILMITTYEKLREMIKEKFDILDQVKDISSQNNLRITVSMGVACWDISFLSLGSYAKNAFDLAEKRGGDQVVVNVENEKIAYFGGKTSAIEKNTKIEARVHAHALKDLIEQSSNVFIMGHKDMDSDSLGAAIGCLRLALYSKKDAYIVYDYEFLDNTVKKIIEEFKLKNQELLKHVLNSDDALELIDSDSLLIACDTQSPNIIMSQDLLNSARKVAIIDHHRASDNSFSNVVYSYVEPYASSTVELITEMISFYAPELKLNKEEASVLLTGIVVDTNDFTFRTGSRTFDVASVLKEHGADMLVVRNYLRENYNEYMELMKLINNSNVYIGKFLISTGDETIFERATLAKCSDQLLRIENIEASFTIGYLTKDKIGISARSFENVNVQVIMEELGGGGHLNNAGAQFENKTIDEVKNMLVQILKRDYMEGDESMKVILLEDLKGRGTKGEIVDVVQGYGNFLLNNNKAIIANAENIKKLEEEKRIIEQQAIEYYNLMLKLKSEIDGKSINIAIKMGDNNRFYGAVTSKQIADEFELQTGIKIDKKKINLDSEINSLGIYTAHIKLHKDIVASFEINVIEK